jgi:hypothetical protein
VPSPSRTTDRDVAGSTSQKNIWVAAGEGDLDRVRHLIEVEGVSPIAPDQWTYTPLHAAASYGQIEVLRFLLNHPSTPANAIETTDEDGDTPLFAAEEVEVARILVEEYRADAKRENAAGDTAAANAEENERLEVAAYLRSVTGEAPMYSAQVDDIDEGEGPLDPAIEGEIEQRTDTLMQRVQEILARAQARGASSGEDLDAQEEEELRRVVGESLFTQIREGWNMTGQDDVNETNTQEEATSDSELANRPQPSR